RANTFAQPGHAVIRPAFYLAENVGESAFQVQQFRTGLSVTLPVDAQCRFNQSAQSEETADQFTAQHSKRLLCYAIHQAGVLLLVAFIAARENASDSRTKHGGFLYIGEGRAI